MPRSREPYRRPAVACIAAKRPTDARVNRAVIINVVAAAVSIVLVGLAWFAFVAEGGDGGDGATTSVDLGVMLALPAQVAWLVLAIVATRMASQARAAQRKTADPLSGVR